MSQPTIDQPFPSPSSSEQSLKNSAFFGVPETIAQVYAQGRRDQVANTTRLFPDVITQANFENHAAQLADLEVIFSTWGMPVLTAQQLDRLPKLQAVFYAAGSVQSFAAPLLERGISVISAWQANAIPVVEFTLAQILLSAKGYFRNVREFRSPEDRSSAFRGRGNFGETVALLGVGAIGRRLRKSLSHFELEVIAYDPFLSDEEARKLGLEKVTLEAAFQRGYIVSNHLADKPETRGILRGEHFESMRPGATFINTGRGASVDEEALIQALQNRPDLTALLDVTLPEPPEAGSPLYAMPNVRLSTHIAGSAGDEIVRMADFCLQEFEAWTRGQPLRYAVSKQMLKSMA